jgi:hypothetical protein
MSWKIVGEENREPKVRKAGFIRLRDPEPAASRTHSFPLVGTALLGRFFRQIVCSCHPEVKTKDIAGVGGLGYRGVADIEWRDTARSVPARNWALQLAEHSSA